MKAILMSIRPQHVCNILNLIKLWEIRKKFPSDYVGWVYIYCTKGRLNLIYDQDYDDKNQTWQKGKYELVDYGDKYSLNGKVVARFWCDKVEDYVNGHKWSWKSGAPMWGACNDYEYILKDTCLTEDELYDYCEDLSFKAIHITKLEIFDKPKELSEFKHLSTGNCWNCKIFGNGCTTCSLTRAPKSWFYIDI